MLKFVDLILGDERLLIAIKQGDWVRAFTRLEIALLKANVIEEESLGFYRKAATLILKHFQSTLECGSDAATRNSEKLDLLAQAIQSIVAPRRSLLKLLKRDNVIELLERILV